jgi:hypothetical protein
VNDSRAKAGPTLANRIAALEADRARIERLEALLAPPPDNDRLLELIARLVEPDKQGALPRSSTAQRSRPSPSADFRNFCPAIDRLPQRLGQAYTRGCVDEGGFFDQPHAPGDPRRRHAAAVRTSMRRQNASRNPLPGAGRLRPEQMPHAWRRIARRALGQIERQLQDRRLQPGVR